MDNMIDSPFKPEYESDWDDFVLPPEHVSPKHTAIPASHEVAYRKNPDGTFHRLGSPQTSQDDPPIRPPPPDVRELNAAQLESDAVASSQEAEPDVVPHDQAAQAQRKGSFGDDDEQDEKDVVFTLARVDTESTLISTPEYQSLKANPVADAGNKCGCAAQMDAMQRMLNEHQEKFRKLDLREQVQNEAENDLFFPNWREIQYLEFWASTTSMHGPGHALAERRYMRKLWIVLTVVFVCICVPFIWSTLDEYFHPQDNWGTSVYEVSYGGSSIEMPNITFCAFNRFEYQRAKQLGMSEALMDIFLNEFAGQALFPFVSSRHYNESYLSDFLHTVNMSRWDLLEYLGPACKDVIVGISTHLNLTKDPNLDLHNTDDVCNAKIDDVTHFEIYYPHDETMGKCVQFIFDAKYVRAYEEGSYGGISFLLDMHTEHYLPELFNNFIDVGFLVDLSFNQRSPGRSIAVSPGFHTWIGMQKQNITYKPPEDFLPINNNPPGCVTDPKLQVIRDSYYSISLCHFDCGLVHIRDKCDCAHTHYESDKYRHCDIELDEECLTEALHELETDEDLQDEEFDCSSSCKPPCQEAYARTSVSVSSILHSVEQRKHLLEYYEKIDPYRASQLSLDTISENFAVVDVFYATMAVGIVEKYKRNTVTDLLSQIGGTMGLWLGASIMTVIHACIVCCKAVKYNWKASKGKF